MSGQYLRMVGAGLLFALLLAFAGAGEALAKSAYSPRHSGLDAPGGPRPLEALPSRGDRSGTMPGNSGYTDAYGNTIDDVPPAEKPKARRPLPGAYGAYGNKSEYDRPLPNPAAAGSKPAWTYQ